MKPLITIIKPILILLLVVNLFFWIVYHASGHKIPIQTDLTFGFISLFLGLGILFLYLKKL